MKLLTLLLALCSLAACATPYQSRGFKGGYYNYELGDKILVGAQVNAFTEPSFAERYAHQRAGEICPHGYNIHETRDASDYIVTGSGVSCNHTGGGDYNCQDNRSSTKKPGIELLINCK